MRNISVLDLQRLSNEIGVSTCLIKAAVSLSRPARMALQMQLARIKNTLKAEASTYVFKRKIAARKYAEIDKIFQIRNIALDQSKKVLDILNFGAEFGDCTQTQDLLNTLLSHVQVKGISLGGHKNSENIANALNFKAQQIAKSVDFAEYAEKIIDAKIDTVNKYIRVLSAIDSL